MGETHTIDLGDSRWLSVLLDASIDAALASPRTHPVPRHLHDLDDEIIEALCSRGLLLGASDATPLPVHARTTAEAAFLEVVRFVFTESAGVLLSQASLRNGRRELRWQLAAFAAALAGELGVAVVLEEAVQRRFLEDEAEARLLELTADAVASRSYLLGNPPGAFPIFSAVAALDARAFIRLAGAQSVHDGPLRPRAEQYSAHLSRAKALLVELMAGVYATAPSQRESEWPRLAARQVRALSMLPHDRRVARMSLRDPRRPADLLWEMSLRTRRHMTEQVILASLLGRVWMPEVRQYIRDAAMAAALTERELDLMESRAAAFLLLYEPAAVALSQVGEEKMLMTALNAASDSFQEAADGIAREAREAGELGGTLARLARGEALTKDERLHLRDQLVDLAKVVPSLAIFAAPGGTLLLPLILKLLPANMLPAAFQTRPPRSPGAV